MSEKQDEYNKSGFFAFIFAMVFSAVFFIYITFVHPGIELDRVDEMRAEAAKLAGDGKAGAAKQTVDVSQNPTPWVSSEDMIAHGQVAYKNNCAFCHGDTGVGNGPAGMGLNPKPRNLVEGKWTADGSTIGLYNSIAKGLPGTAMAAFGHLPKIDRWAMVHYIQSITKNNVESPASELETFGKTAK